MRSMCLEWCDYCNAEVAIYDDGVTQCPVCGHHLYPCNQCDCNDISCSKECPYVDQPVSDSPFSKERIRVTIADACSGEAEVLEVSEVGVKLRMLSGYAMCHPGSHLKNDVVDVSYIEIVEAQPVSE